MTFPGTCLGQENWIRNKKHTVSIERKCLLLQCLDCSSSEWLLKTSLHPNDLSEKGRITNSKTAWIPVKTTGRSVPCCLARLGYAGDSLKAITCTVIGWVLLWGLFLFQQERQGVLELCEELPGVPAVASGDMTPLRTSQQPATKWGELQEKQTPPRWYECQPQQSRTTPRVRSTGYASVDKGTSYPLTSCCLWVCMKASLELKAFSWQSVL